MTPKKISPTINESIALSLSVYNVCNYIHKKRGVKICSCKFVHTKIRVHYIYIYIYIYIDMHVHVFIYDSSNAICGNVHSIVMPFQSLFVVGHYGGKPNGCAGPANIENHCNAPSSNLYKIVLVITFGVDLGCHW